MATLPAAVARSVVVVGLGCQAQLDLDDYTFQARGTEQGGAFSAPTSGSDRATRGAGGAEPSLAAGGTTPTTASTDQGAGGAIGGSGNETRDGGTMTSTGGRSDETPAPDPVPTAPPTGQCQIEDDLLVLYRDRTNGEASSNVISMEIGVQNLGAPTFELTDLTLRYWFADDGFPSFVADVDYATQNAATVVTSAVSVTFGEEPGASYADIGFTSGGPVGPEGVQQIQIRLHTAVYDILEQTNDFSFIPGASTDTPNRNITPYIAGVQAGGCVPEPALP